jgi:hypothetical protein
VISKHGKKYAEVSIRAGPPTGTPWADRGPDELAGFEPPTLPSLTIALRSEATTFQDVRQHSRAGARIQSGANENLISWQILTFDAHLGLALAKTSVLID